MKILQLCKKFPYPPKDGESIAVNTLSRALHELGCEVSLLAMNTHKHFFDAEGCPQALGHYKEVFRVPVDNRIKPVEAFLNLFSKESYHIARFVSPEEFAAYRAHALELGFAHCEAGPLVRSSYHAHEHVDRPLRAPTPAG